MDLYRVLRPLLFSLPPDMAHDVSQWAFRRRLWTRFPVADKPRLDLRTNIAGIELRNPLGLAAGFDKNGDITPAMASLGFGFVVTGSVRANPHPGNPRPWFARRVDRDGMVNAMGLPSKGAGYVHRRLEHLRLEIPFFNSVVGENVPDLLQAYEALKGLGAAWEINLSCPNTDTGRTFEEDDKAYDELLRSLAGVREPLLLKLSPYEDEEGRDTALEMANKAIRRGITYFTLCNTLLVDEERLGIGRGGLSGRPIFPLCLRAVKDFYEEWGEKVSLVGVGGITSGREAFQMLTAGASALEVLTALILRGPFVVRDLLRELQEQMEAHGFGSVGELVGQAT